MNITTDSEIHGDEPPGREWQLAPQSEYRFELDPDVILSVKARLIFAHLFATR